MYKQEEKELFTEEELYGIKMKFSLLRSKNIKLST